MSTTARAEQARAGVLLRERLVRREKADLVHQIGRVAGPAFGHRAAEKHADAAGAVHRRDAADLGLAGVRVVVLHVMADRAVMDDVIQLDHAGVGGAQPSLLLVGRHVGVDRRDDVVVHRQAIERRRRSIEQVVEKRCRVARLRRNRHVADRRRRPGDEVRAVRRAPGSRPRSADRRRDSRRRRDARRRGAPALPASRLAPPNRARRSSSASASSSAPARRAQETPRSGRSGGRALRSRSKHPLPPTADPAARQGDLVASASGDIPRPRRTPAPQAEERAASSRTRAPATRDAVAQQPRGAVAFVQTLRPATRPGRRRRSTAERRRETPGSASRRAASASARCAAGANGRVISEMIPNTASPSASDGFPRWKCRLSISAIWTSRNETASARSRAATSRRGRRSGRRGPQRRAQRCASRRPPPRDRPATSRAGDRRARERR